jgi:hypothetical protein
MGGKKPNPYFGCTWESLADKIAPEVLRAPKTGGEWPAVHERIIRYLLAQVVDQPWGNHAALMAAVLAARRQDVRTVEFAVRSLHVGFSRLFPALGLETVEDWHADRHLPRYLKAEVVPTDSQYTRFQFLRKYTSATTHVWNWFAALPADQQHRYRRFVLPLANPLLVEGIISKKAIESRQQQQRKRETEAVVPHFAELRAEAHFRYNKLARLRTAYRQAVAQVLPDRSNLPLDFSYEEGEPPVERLHFTIWDRYSFVHAHAEAYRNRSARSRFHRQAEQFSKELNGLFLECVKVERLADSAPPEEWWFTGLLKRNLLSQGPRHGTPEEIASRQAWLRTWGYGEEGDSTPTTPFMSHTAGILCWTDGTNPGSSSDGLFLSGAQEKAQGVLIHVESLYVSALFGLLALDVLTSTGMRMNELLQMSISRTCLVQLVEDPPVTSSDQSPRIRYLFRLIPKGERTLTLHNYAVGKETIRLVEKVCHMLSEHYQLQPGESLPHVPFSPGDGRSHRFGPAPYLFQYCSQHLNGITITACLRFLLHGLIFTGSDGKPVTIKAHLLRHAFATYAVQIEGVPLDLVAEWLKQKNLEVTDYYSKKTPGMVAEEHASFVSRLAARIQVREAILRSPQEIQKQAEAALKRVGMLVPVCGGDCTLDISCPNQFDCIHCPAKAPDPAKRYQVEEKMRWARERLSYYEHEDLVLETEKMKQLIRACELELKEMEHIATYRQDEKRQTLIQLQPRTQERS